MKAAALPPFILADQLERLTDWYSRVFDLIPLIPESSDSYQVCYMMCEDQIVLSLASAAEMGLHSHPPRTNGAIPQLCVDDVGTILGRVWEENGAVLFGPSRDEAYGGYTYGGFSDPEGNQVWLVDREITPQASSGNRSSLMVCL